MASIRKSPNGRGWQIRYRDNSGRQRTMQCTSKTEAQARMRSMETEVERKTWVDPANGKLRFRDYATAWRASTSHLRAGSLANLDARLGRHILPQFGEWQIGNIEPADVRAWVSELITKGLAPATVASTYGVFNRIMSTAVIDGIISRSPCIGVQLPRHNQHQEMHFLSPRQVAELANEFEPRYQALIYTAAYTGMRWGELAGLQVLRCNLLRGVIEVSEALTETNGHLALGPTKTGKTRAISVPKFLLTMLNDQVTTYPSAKGYVFTSSEGLPLRRNFYRRHFKPAVKRPTVPDALRFHDLRHTCVAMLISNGAHPKEIQERLGHSTIRLTFDRYGHLLPTLDDRLRDGLEDLWTASQISVVANSS